jgi:hypothetical protein
MEIVIKGGSLFDTNISNLQIIVNYSVPTTSYLFLKGFRVLKISKT